MTLPAGHRCSVQADNTLTAASTKTYAGTRNSFSFIRDAYNGSQVIFEVRQAAQ